ncbi:hypothetical protein KI688_010565 [Linnemannia hyalina]|uniref:F-box domain-containing protein n=1 Tax=Linnemannia hyalina TaxID=64524 RepID=A0A9P7XVQ0_9FUNG|nr:hypothetical protein KI688_010565 [Linnemannia hyalina]
MSTLFPHHILLTMSPFDIPELVDQLRYYLSPHDLTVCVRVSKAWNAMFIPYLWYSVPPTAYLVRREDDPPLESYRRHDDRFSQLVQRDYLSTLLQAHINNNNNNNNNSNSPLPVTSRNGRWIRVLELQQSFLQWKPIPAFIEHAATEGETTPESPPDPEFIFHMLQQCTRLQRLQIEGRVNDAQELESWSKILGSGLPRTITNFTLVIDYPRVQIEQRTEENWDNGEEEPLPSLRILNVTCQSSRLYSPPLLKFITRCTHLESLHISRLNETWTGVLGECLHLKSLRIVIFDTKSAQLLTDELRNGLPSLANIHIDCYFEDMRDQDLANMFSACRTGWRSINAPCIDKLAVEAIVQHCPTMEELSLKRAHELSSKHMQQILSSSPRLRSFITLIDEDDSLPYIDASQILALDFIDADSSSDFLRPWACESTLTVLRAKILGIPRPDITKTYSGRPLEDGMVLPEDYVGQGQDIGRRVYERLARFTRLERLELGHEDRDVYYPSRKIRGLDDIGHQYTCLEMSLKSGLRILEGLKQLRVLSVVRMATLIGVEERSSPSSDPTSSPSTYCSASKSTKNGTSPLIPLLWHTIDSSLPTWHKILKEFDSEHAQGQMDEQWLQLLFNKYAHHIRALENPGLTFLHMSRNLRRLGNLANELGQFHHKALSGLKNLVTFSDPYYRLSLPALLRSLPLVKHLCLELPRWNRLLDTLELKKGLVYIGDVFNILKHCPNVVYLGFEGVRLEPIKYFEDMEYGDDVEEEEVVLFGVEDAKAVLGGMVCQLERLCMSRRARFEHMQQFLPLLPYLAKCHFEEEQH